MRRRLAGSLCAAIAVAGLMASSAGAQEPVPPLVQDTLGTVTGAPVYQHSIWGWRVIDLSSGDVLTEQNSNLMFVTGSILKLYATGTALSELGPNHRFRTPVYRRGKLSRGSLAGNLFLVASGDYSFGLRDRPNGTMAFNSLPEVDHNYADTGLPGAALVPNSNPLAALNQLARQVRASGVRRVKGDVVIDDRLFDTYEGWPDGVMAPMWVNENVIDITTRPTRTGRPASVDWRPRTAAFRVENDVETVSGQGTPLTVDSPRAGVVRISGSIGRGSDPIVNIFLIPDPVSFGRTAFIEALRRAGVTVQAKSTGGNPKSLLPRSRTYPRRDRVAQHVSPPLSEFVKVILKVSYNRGADDMVCLVAAAKGSRNCPDGLDTELALVKSLGVSPVTTILFDGAGSSEFDRSSLPDFTTYLRNVTAQSWGPALRHGLPILGVDGTFATNQKGTPAAGHVFVKSGTRAQGAPTGQGILSAITQAGYIDAQSGRRLVYAMFLRDLALSPDFSQFTAADHDQGTIAAAFQQGY